MLRTLRVELHAHTQYSHDGHIGFNGMLEMARRRKLDAIAITDHDTIDGALDLCRRHERWEASGVSIIVGEERTLSSKMHIVGLFLHEAIMAEDLQTAVEEISYQGGLCVIPHPYRRVSGALASAFPEAQRAPLCFEIFNPTCSYEENRRARILAQLGWTPVGGSDAHYQSELGECVNQIPFQGTVEHSVREALAGRSRVMVFGVRQVAGASGRAYAPLLYRRWIKPHFQVPCKLKPAADQMFQALRGSVREHSRPQLELKWDTSLPINS